MGLALKQENELPFLSLVEEPMLKVLPGGKAEAKPLAEIIPFDSSNLERDCTYDKVSNVTQKTTPNAKTLSYGYDALNRLITKTTSEQTYAYTYDTLSQLTNATNAASALTFGYDSIGELTSTKTAAPQPAGTLSYSYDSAMRKTTFTVGSWKATYGYDKANRLTSIANTSGTTFTFGYDLGGRRTNLKKTTGSTLERTYNYDNANRLIELISKSNGTEITHLQYQYDKTGNKTDITDKYGEHIPSYDALYRLINLTNALTTGGQETFNYDLTGNRTSDQTQTYSTNELNQITHGTNNLSLTYDNNGNTVTKTENGITWTYTWNSENQLTKITNNAQTPITVTYEYDALGRRITQTTTQNSATTKNQWIYDGEDLYLEYENGISKAYYIHGPNTDEPLAKSMGGTLYSYHPDGLGSIAAITSGGLVESYRYTSFGKPTIYDKNGATLTSSTIKNPYLFTGREYNSETKLTYRRNRYDDPSIGIFLSPDPSGFDDGPNKYILTGDNPINWTDPLGLYPLNTTASDL
ncbi:MAG: hypothetical protein HYS07_08780 [Chlamydiae bacterium]|nr:hypothetical protein [Chlamydiota bacterium]MBI3276992.1 hypothetical protein [Chlamydiota bacterium]